MRTFPVTVQVHTLASIWTPLKPCIDSRVLVTLASVKTTEKMFARLLTLQVAVGVQPLEAGSPALGPAVALAQAAAPGPAI